MNDPQLRRLEFNRWLIVGIGSPTGNDRLGWDVSQFLAGQLPSPWTIRQARVPTDLLDWLEGCERLHLVDACPVVQEVGRVHRLEWPDPRILQSRTATSHDYDVPQVLRLAERLGQLPEQVVVWAIEVDADVDLVPAPNWMVVAAGVIRNAVLSEGTI